MSQKEREYLLHEFMRYVEVLDKRTVNEERKVAWEQCNFICRIFARNGDTALCNVLGYVQSANWSR